MASNAEISQAYSSIQQAFLSDTKPRINSVIQRSETLSWDEIGGDIISVRNDLESIYSQINNLINQAKANNPQDTGLIGRMETSLNTNRGTNLSLIGQAEARARSNQEPPSTPEDTESIGEEAPDNENQTAGDVEGETPDSTATTTKETNDDEFTSSSGSNMSMLPEIVVTAQRQKTVLPPDYGYSMFSGVYKVISIKNIFEGGKFEQTLNLARLSDLEEEFNQQKKDIAETKEAIENKKQEIEPLLRVKTLPEAQFIGAKLVVAKKDGGLDVFKAGESAINEGMGKASSISDDFASSIGDGFKSITDGISNGIGDITSTVGGGIDNLINLGSDASIPYEGDDPIVIERLRRQRAAQGIQVDDAVNRD